MKDRFHTVFEIPESDHKISYQTPCIFMGSCFSDEIGEQMASLKFPVLLNPFGTLFNPASIAANMDRLISGKLFLKDDLQHHNGVWFSFSHYTAFSNSNADICLSDINDACKEASEKLASCNYLILTFGTAWIFTHKESGKVVANCHKLPASVFEHTLMEPDEIISLYDQLINRLYSFNPALRIIFTVSPVRHWSNGAVNNQLSKSILHYSIQTICRHHPSASYFPAYEIFMDELRDYRFYAEDMLHPSPQGIRYVWEKFSDAWIDESSKKIIAELTTVLKAVRHRPLHKETIYFNQFRERTLEMINKLVQRYPFLDFTNEIAELHPSA